MKIKFSAPTEYDYRKFEDTLSRSCLDGRIKITATVLITAPRASKVQIALIISIFE